MSDDPIVIVGMARAPMGGFQGDLQSATASELGATAIRAALQRAGLSGEDVDEVVMGNILSAGQGQAPARQASIGGGIPDSVGCTTINKMCGSGMQAAMFAHDMISAGTNEIMVAGGMESMSNTPYLLDRARQGYRMGHGQVKDHMFLDGLEDAYDKGTLMGVFAEATAQKYQFTREQQDEFAITSLTRARTAIEDGSFAGEIAPFTVKTRKGETEVTEDEQPPKANLDKIPQLRPAFAKDGSVTAANSSSISDGAAALVLMCRSEADKRGLKPLGIIRGHATHAHEPAWFTTAPGPAISGQLGKVGWNKDEVGLFEINEAFAAQVLPSADAVGIDLDKLNVNGGAIALGHPFGMTGARIMTTLLNGLEDSDKEFGVESMCVGGGQGMAMVVQRLN